MLCKIADRCFGSRFAIVWVWIEARRGSGHRATVSSRIRALSGTAQATSLLSQQRLGAPRATTTAIPIVLGGSEPTWPLIDPSVSEGAPAIERNGNHTLETSEALMRLPAQAKPAIWGVIGGAVAAMIIGFAWGGWVTGGTSDRNAAVAANTAVVQALVPLCVAKAEQQPEQVLLMKKETVYSRYDFVIKAGWVSSVSESYRRPVAESCATAIADAMDATAAKKS
jgi:hypothetical protein